MLSRTWFDRGRLLLSFEQVVLLITASQIILPADVMGAL
ncbi:hypothetical Protein YC6258_01406 [Gynuella sunshinyii YC6258]|uniref:Uncharacterized protein n=1 Tax=Gynuella sunshinyii YC6258 TaxID=1445510 RepID=A0A0C5V1M9_9GAMM|nr:hypothetical Protein YC6258_01406 [Gynuella sunshinyii YC6258]